MLESTEQVTNSTIKTSGVAERYASALFELARDAGTLDAVEADMAALGALIGESDDLRRLIRSPVFSADDQARAIGAVIDKAGIGGLVANFVRLTATNRRLFAIPDMVTAFRAILAAHRGEMTAEVTSAEPLSDGHVSALKEALKATFGKDVTIDAKIDASILGGLIVKVGSRMIDSSLKTKLNSLRLAMKEVG